MTRDQPNQMQACSGSVGEKFKPSFKMRSLNFELRVDVVEVSKNEMSGNRVHLLNLSFGRETLETVFHPPLKHLLAVIEQSDWDASSWDRKT